MLLQKDKLSILREACSTEEFNTDNIFDADILDYMSKELNFLPELEEDLLYTEEMVNVLLQETSFGNRYLVEIENLVKLMESSNIDIKTALEKVCEHNEINIGDTYVVIESAETILESLKQFSRESSLKSKSDIKDTVKTIQDLKDKGIKLLTRKSKSKKKKKKK